jgi:hypothetical protein
MSVMEFTKAEKKLLDSILAPKQRGQVLLFIAGILFMAAGIGVWAYSYFLIIPFNETSFKQLETSISGIQVQTQQGTALKQMLLESKRQIAQNQNTSEEAGFNQASFYLLLIGFLFIVVYFENRTYRGLIVKLKSAD